MLIASLNHGLIRKFVYNKKAGTALHTNEKRHILFRRIVDT
jgi:hypothetical protein